MLPRTYSLSRAGERCCANPATAKTIAATVKISTFGACCPRAVWQESTSRVVRVPSPPKLAVASSAAAPDVLGKIHVPQFVP